MSGMLQTEFEFTLPSGYVDDEGTLHRDGVMRLATAADEILPLKDPRVRSNESYLTVILISRVVTQLGSLDDVSPSVVENLFVTDLGYLQDLYVRVNSRGADVVDAVCPACGEEHEVELHPTAAAADGSFDVGADDELAPAESAGRSSAAGDSDEGDDSGDTTAVTSPSGNSRP
ncbi:hypothetical protein NDI76_20545 [Halogeometricum sp. S1BR25-6]|uniref:Secreted protein n=1 Tax=Halogeometricum salsisoli TaxID=2950536 RepID=A0ABU2GK30_9EURY|nr:hypothetical protein [Halogeometricum sp. S1BR25-6]MDS0301130.1 hypothetical protein [Halogeometricum sp. S1BR25-6]